MHTSLTALKNFVRAAACLALLAAATAHAGEEAGKVVLAVGDARLADQPTQIGAVVHVGDKLVTGSDGYLYIKTSDNGFLILRPKTQATIAAYNTDPQNPANSRFKIELAQGVARSISGEAVKQARQNFRFNTPVAAIGVRGTDFTVFTDQQTSRILVTAGGIVASGFGGACAPEGSGPCEGSNSRELFAAQSGQFVQVNRGQVAPQLVRGNAIPSELGAPPRSDEPLKSSSNTDLVPLKISSLDKQPAAPITPPAAMPPGPPTIVWGRWQAVADQPANLDLNNQQSVYLFAGINNYFAILQRRDAIWQAPSGGNVSFAMQGGQAVIQTDGANPILAGLENGKLSVDFSKSSFTTQFDIVASGQRINRQAEGGVAGNGTFSNPSQFLGNSNMVVQGVLANTPQGGLNAAYLFQSRLDDHRLATGVTSWSK